MLEYERITNYTLWFDVEKKYKTIRLKKAYFDGSLWFDVEKKYKTISSTNFFTLQRLWFDVEKKYKTIDYFEIVGLGML